jgi:hypothetical protein
MGYLISNVPMPFGAFAIILLVGVDEGLRGSAGSSFAGRCKVQCDEGHFSDG